MTDQADMTGRFDSLRLLEALLFASADPLSAARVLGYWNGRPK